MRTIEEVRKDINDVDIKMAKLFEERMSYVEEILKYKKSQNLAIIDENREKQLLQKNLTNIHDEELKKYYKTFFEGVLKSSKDYQEDNYE